MTVNRKKTSPIFKGLRSGLSKDVLIFIISIIICFYVAIWPKSSFSQTSTASLLPMPLAQFFDNNGNPLTSGTVGTYAPGTLTFQTTWKDSGETIPNTNPIVLDAGGKAIIYGNQTYRQIVKDRNGNLIWDAVTAPGGGGGSTPTLIGDGEAVGTIKQWAGLIVPNQYAYAYGQQLSRINFPELLAAITQQLNLACTTSSNNFTAISDTTQINIGSPVESICVAPGTTVVSKTASSVILSNPSTLTINTTATFFPFGNGDGSTTFNVPDMRGYVGAGRDNMGGTAAARLPSTFDGLGGSGGASTVVISQSNLPNITLATTIAAGQGAHSHKETFTSGGGATSNVTGSGSNVGSPVGTGITTDTISSTLPQMTGTTPLGGLATGLSILQPTISINYIIKITPDTPASSVTGVSSLGGMQGIIACGQGINCSGNTISANGQLAGGFTNNVQYNQGAVITGATNFNYISPDTVELGAAGITGKFNIYGSTSGKVTQQASATAGTPTITWGTSSGTPAVTATSPLFISSTTGNINISPDTFTRVNDTNVTATLTGNPTIALVNPMTFTLGWTGQLALTRGGTNNSLTASNGGVVWSDATKLNILSGTATANLPLLSGSTATPIWASVAYFINSGVSGGIPYFSSTTQISSSNLLTANQIMVGGGTGAAPTTFACATTTTLVHGGTPPTCSQLVNGDITTNTISNDKLIQAVAASIRGNPSSGTANVLDFTIQNLSNLAAPSATLDFIPIYDHVAGTIKNVTPGAIAGSVVAGVASVNTLVGSLTLAVTSGLNLGSNGSTTLTISPDIATATNFFAGTANKILDANVVFSNEQTITYNTTTGISGDTLINGKVTLTGNITTLNCSGFKASQAGTIAFIQDGSGSRTAAFNTGTCSTILRFANATYPTLTTSASAVDILSYSCRSSTYCAAGLSKGYNP